jgi:hypothetical protein
LLNKNKNATISKSGWKYGTAAPYAQERSPWTLIEQLSAGMTLQRSALFSSKTFCKIEIVTLLFVFDRYCSIID